MPEKKQGNYEHSDLQVKMMVITIAVIVAFALIVFAVSVPIAVWLRDREPITTFQPSPLAQEHAPWTGEARLQGDPVKEWKTFIAEETEALSAFGIVSRDPVVYRIPIETAMDIVAEQGFPKFKALAPPEDNYAREETP